MPATSQSGADCDSKPRKRVVTSARREQNRVAQKAYRKRQKEIRDTAREETRVRRDPPLQPRSKTLPQAHPSTLRPEESSAQASSTEVCQNSNEVPSLSASDSAFPCGGEPSHSLYQGDPSLIGPEDEIISDLPQSQAGSSSLVFSPSSTSHSSSSTIHPSLGLGAMTLFSAALQNALCLGYDLVELATCGPDYMSPFYRPEMTPRSDPATMSTSNPGPGIPDSQSLILGAGNSRIPDHLAPTFIQMTIPHHASFDLIPIPLLRDRAILLSITMPHRFNIHELKLDIYERGGLTVWQQGFESYHHARGRSSCQPWEMSSWEAAPWFIEKWCMVVGGPDGDLSQQSLMWRAFRAAINTQ